MSSEESVMARMIGKGRSFILVTPNSIIKPKIITSIDKFVTKIEEFIVDGQYENALMWLKILKDPNIFVMRGLISEARETLSLQRVEKQIRSDIEKQMRDSGSLGSKQEAYDTLIKVNAELDVSQKTSLLKKGISFWILNEGKLFPNYDEKDQYGHWKKMKLKDEYYIWAVKYIPTYKMEWYANERDQGQRKLPECYIGVRLRVLGKTLSVSETVRVVNPTNYKHPFVYSQKTEKQRMCLGSATKAMKDKMSKTSSILKLVDILLDQGEYILKYGYNQSTGGFIPAGKHLSDPIYEKISDKVSPEFLKLQEEYKRSKRKIKRNGGL